METNNKVLHAVASSMEEEHFLGKSKLARNNKKVPDNIRYNPLYCSEIGRDYTSMFAMCIAKEKNA